MPTTKDPVGYETRAIEAGDDIKNAIDRLVKIIAWQEAKKEGRETVTPQDILKSLDIAFNLVNDFLRSNEKVTVKEALDAFARIGQEYASK